MRVIRAYGSFLNEKEVKAGDHVIEARRIVIATGSSPLVPPIPGLEKVEHFTNEDIFDLREQPDHLLIVGGGPIGMEMAQAHVRLGSKVTVIEGLKALGKDDPDAAALVLDKLRGEGVEIVEGARAQKVTKRGKVITVETSNGTFKGSHLLIAVGRKVNLRRLNLDKAGVGFDKGGVKVDASLRSTSNKRVYAIGDAAGGMQFTHVAGYHAGVIIRSMLFGLPSRAKTGHIPWVTYTEPELAQIGPTEAEAVKKHGRGAITTVRFLCLQWVCT